MDGTNYLKPEMNCIVQCALIVVMEILKGGPQLKFKKKKKNSPPLDKDVGAEDVSTHSSSNYRHQRVKKRSILSLFLKVVFLADIF